MSKNREPLEQNIHDTAIADLAKELLNRRPSLIVRTNPGTSKDYGLKTNDKTYYPDIYTFENDEVKRIFEIETESTANESSIEQWKLYSSGSAEFYLVVPKESLQETKELVDKYHIDVAGYWTY